MQDKKTLSEEFIRFYDLVKQLRNECPWDKEQTHESLRRCLLEETYEVLEAIDRNDNTELKKELGDLLLQIVFHSILGEESNSFNLSEIMSQEREKLIERHPHIFGDVKVTGSEEVKSNWEKLKRKEGRESALDGIPKELPALLKAYRLQEKASKVGFDWKASEPVFAKIREELEELKVNIESCKPDSEIENELGDLLFSIVNYSRFLKINPEDALRRTIEKFSTRFRKIEEMAKNNGNELDRMTLSEMDELWDEAKKNEV